MTQSFDKLKIGQEVPSEQPEYTDLNGYLPPNYSEQRFRNGQKFFHNHLVGVLFSYMMSMLVGFYIPRISETLAFTGQSTGAKQSRKRYQGTLLRIYLWHSTYDTELLKSMRFVNAAHKDVKQKLTDAQPSDRPYLSQYDFSVAQSCFVMYVLLYAKQCGIRCKDEELSDYIYMWYVIGHMLGMEDEYNLCRDGVANARLLCEGLMTNVIIPGIIQPTPVSSAMANDFIEGNQSSGFLAVSQKTLFAYFFPDMGLKVEQLSWSDWISCWLLKITFICYYYFGSYRNYFNAKIEKAILRKIKMNQSKSSVNCDTAGNGQ